MSMKQDWVEREVGGFASAVAKLINRGAPSMELPIAPLTDERQPLPDEQAAPPPERQRRRDARRRHKRAGH